MEEIPNDTGCSPALLHPCEEKLPSQESEEQRVCGCALSWGSLFQVFISSKRRSLTYEVTLYQYQLEPFLQNGVPFLLIYMKSLPYMFALVDDFYLVLSSFFWNALSSQLMINIFSECTCFSLSL